VWRRARPGAGARRGQRGKSTLVNALFGAPLLPTGALPLTSVTTVVAVGDTTRAEIRYRHGEREDIALGAVAELGSEKGNPGNERGVDRCWSPRPASSFRWIRRWWDTRERARSTSPTPTKLGERCPP
jgi:hypothetical protein